MRHGAGAGNPVADLLFAIAYGKMVMHLRSLLREAGLVATVSFAGAQQYFGWQEQAVGNEVPLDDASVADDLAFVVGVTADQCIRTLQVVGNIPWRAYAISGFRVSWGLEKRL